VPYPNDGWTFTRSRIPSGRAAAEHNASQ